MSEAQVDVDVERKKPRVSVRAARPDDAHQCAPLVFASGEREFLYFLGVTPERCIAFLEVAFRSRTGRFSWRRHRVAIDEYGAVTSVLALHDGRSMRWDDPSLAWMLVRYFGAWRAGRMLARGLVLETELPKPSRDQILMAHCAVAEPIRGQGIFTALFEQVTTSTLRAADPDRLIVLDVLVENQAARTLYERLGFVANVPARRPRSKRLPVSLYSIRMSRLPARVVGDHLATSY
ncbi:GNAT family N-acetyltransferase [Caballeronia cordobensis]|uniref:GNAT family N-acetyltransferase n=1 Tax=Caballeronia cordobensis TaxID=1353886 RepID=UPI0006AD5EFD